MELGDFRDVHAERPHRLQWRVDDECLRGAKWWSHSKSNGFQLRYSRASLPRLDYSPEAYMMTSPAIAIKNEIPELIQLQVEMFGQPHALTFSELIECSYPPNE